MKSRVLLWWGLTAGGIAIIALVLGMVLLGPGGSNGTGIYSPNNGYGMMGSSDMMGGYTAAGGMMGGGYGSMMGSFGGSQDTSTPPLTVDQARDAVNRYLDYRGNSDLKIREVFEFTNGFYARVDEQDTGAGAFEVLIDRNSGVVSPEPGPNMMWNTKYGMMGGGFDQAQPSVTTEMPIKKDDASSRAQKFLDRQLPGTQAGGPDTFYGYYTIEIKKDGNTLGMLSVDGYNGQVWYHSWHGAFLSEKQF